MAITSPAKLAAVILLAGIGNVTAASPATPQQTAARFCALYNRGVLQEQYAPLLSTSLTAKLREAQRKDTEFSARHPGDKPPLGNGLPFAGLQDVGRCRAGQPKAVGGETLAAVSFRFNGGPSITNRLLLVQEDGAWKIGDIRYPKGDFYPTFSAFLADIAKGQ